MEILLSRGRRDRIEKGEKKREEHQSDRPRVQSCERILASIDRPRSNVIRHR